MNFAEPNFLVLLLVLPPAAALFLWWSARKRRELMTQFIQARLLPGLIAGVSPRRQKVRFACLILAVASLLFALAGPRWGFSWQEVKQRGVDIVVAIDTSKSMLAEDIQPNRLARAKLAALDLMQLAKNDRLGLVAFAGTAFLQCPLTIDDSAFRQSVDALDVNTLPEGGTALAEAIETAMTAYKEGDNHRILVLLTDGEDHDSGAVEAAQKASQAGLRIYTIGVGTAQGELLRIKDAQGKVDYIRDEEGHVVKSHLNQDLLVELASATGGFYLPLQGPKTMNTLFEHPQGIAQLPKSEHQEKLVKQLHERYHWPLGAAILLLIVEMLVPERARQRKATAVSAPPAIPSGAASRPVAAVVTMLLLFLASVPLQASTSSALREYKAGKYDEALKEYQELLQKKTDDPRLHFNAGTAAYQNHKYDEAAKQFDQAIGSPDLKLQELGYYNRGNSLFRLGEKFPDPAKRTEVWEKSLKDFELSTRLNPQDADAKFNHEFVKRKLEELKQQQQQQNKSDQQKSDQQKPQDEQNQSQQQQDKQNQQQQQQQDQQNQGQQNQDQNQQGQQQPDKGQDQQQKQASQSQDQQQPPDTQKQNQQQSKPDQQQPKQAAAQPKKDSGEKGDKEWAAYAAAQMTQEQAERLLDAQKGDEMMLPPRPPPKPRDRPRPLKDW